MKTILLKLQEMVLVMFGDCLRQQRATVGVGAGKDHDSPPYRSPLLYEPGVNARARTLQP